MKAINLEDSPRNPFELPRIPGYREHGFDGFDKIYNWVLSRLKKHDWRPFLETQKNEHSFITISCEKHSGFANPYYNLSLDVGYVDFQDGALEILAGIDFCLYESTKQVTVLRGFGEKRLPSIEYDSIIEQITTGYIDRFK